MGGCASTQNKRIALLAKSSGSAPKRLKGKTKKQVKQVIRVVFMDGRVQEFKPPICAAQILSQNPGCVLCWSDSLFIDSCPDHVPEPEELRPGHLYVLMHKSQAYKPLSLEDLCELAIKASSNLIIDDLQLSFRHYVV